MIDWTNESEKEQRDSALEDRMAKADAAIDAKALDAIAKDMGLHDGANRDAALGLPLVMTSPDSTRNLDTVLAMGIEVVEVTNDDGRGRLVWMTRDRSKFWFVYERKWIESRPDWYTAMYGSYKTQGEAFDNIPTESPHDGTTPGQQPSRTDAASLSETQARREACRVVEAAAWNALLYSGLTREQLVLLDAYNDSIHATRKAELDMHYTMFAKGGSL